MVKVIVVDDEYLAREGMKRTIEWEKYGCTIVGEAEDAFGAIELAKVEKPDLIITDINMPEMNGLEMAKNIREILPNSKFIVITGYDDLNYAIGAVKVNAMDFLLKPIDEKEFLNAIEKAANECVKTRESVSITQEKMLLDMMRGKIGSYENIYEEIRRHNVSLQKLLIVSIQNDNYEKILEMDNMKLIYEQNQIIREAVNKSFLEEHYVIECHEDKLALILSCNNISCEKEIQNKLKNIQSIVKSRCNITISMGVSSIMNFEDIQNIYSQGKKALKNRLYSGKGSITYFKDMSKEVCDEDKLEWGNLHQKEKELVLSIKACDKKRVKDGLKYIYHDIFKCNKISDDTIKQISINLILKSLESLKDFNINMADIVGENFNVYKKTTELNTLEELYAWVEKLIFEILYAIKEVKVEIAESGIKDALDYMTEHYNENISLNDVATKVYLSESYLSRKIKKVMGVSFVEYLTKLRVSKAMEYLTEPEAKIAEVASKVGYTDYRYFSHVFKKYTGYSPSEFMKVPL
ncbi:response regulator transcription factor [Haloimpatiens lingqiaonensis]|uniref:response regulator transcription factor n=1 Tax=Haloimpatiens lingqiaonensis TaxID=1380675 RepID=UPI0010FDEF15|nr:response regulator [Haloimpatiens lingqiaonensis]